MAGKARPSHIPVGLVLAVCFTGFTASSSRAENGEGSGLLMAGVSAYAATPTTTSADEALAKALALPLSQGPLAHVPLPRERSEAIDGADDRAEAPLAGPRVAVPLPRERPDFEDGPATVAALGGSATEAAPEEPAGRLPVFASGPAAETSGSSGIRSLIARHASANGIPFGLADAIVRVESRYNPRARNGANIGLMQISLPTARSLGYGGAAAGLADADTNLTYGVRYLAQAYRLADGDTCRTVMKYQGGHRAITMTSAARSYCDKVRMHAANLR